MYLLVYVDDLIFTGSDASAIQHCLSALRAVFPLKDLGALHYFLGIECIPSSQGLVLSQRKYITDLLDRTNMLLCKPVSTPMATNIKLSALDSPDMEDPTMYRRVVGSLQYLLFTRPDVAFAVNRVCQFMHRPKISHWQAVKRILRYLKHTQHFGLLLTPSSQSTLTAFSDADWAGCPDDRRSTNGYCVFYGSNVITWVSKKQTTIARSSTEAEYKALANATSEVLWIQSLLAELGIILRHPPTLYCDNLGATYLSQNPVMHSRTKHVDIDFHFVRERVQSNSLHVRFLPGDDQIADILTKSLPPSRYVSLRSSLTVLPRPLDSTGDVKHITTALPNTETAPQDASGD